MSIGYNHLTVTVDLAAIRHNYREMCARGSAPMPVIKADAYGHGLKEVAAALAGEGATVMCAGTVGESVELRQAFSGQVIALLGPLAAEDYAACVSERIIPFIGQAEQLRLLAEAARKAGQSVPLALKCDTGMGRLGFSPRELAEALEILAGEPLLRVAFVASHLATADDPDKLDYVRLQGERFRACRDMVAAAGHNFACTLANSAGLLAHPDLHFDAQRPGITLYGGNPFHGTAWEEKASFVRPAMQVTTRILQVHELAQGECLSYGCTFRAEKAMRIAIVGAGYADCYSRGLSNRGRVLVRGIRAPICGRVCMQLAAVDVTEVPGVAAGDTVWLLGGEGPAAISPDELAGWWGSISYEAMCVLGLNPRVYRD